MAMIVVDVDFVGAYSDGTRAYLAGDPRLSFRHHGAELEAFVLGWDAAREDDNS